MGLLLPLIFQLIAKIGHFDFSNAPEFVKRFCKACGVFLFLLIFFGYYLEILPNLVQVETGPSKEKVLIEDTSLIPNQAFNYRAGLADGTKVYFDSKANPEPGFVLENGKYRLSFVLNEETKDQQEDLGSKIYDLVEKKKPEVGGNQVDYQVVVKGIPMILRYTVSETKVKEELIIEKKPDDEWFANYTSKINEFTPTGQKVIEKELRIAFDVETTGLQKIQNGNEYTYIGGKINWKILDPLTLDSQGNETRILGAFLNNDSKYSLFVPIELLKNSSYPLSIDPTVILSGGFSESEAAQGGQQRKLVYANGNWYAFYNDNANIYYKKSSDGSTWGGAVTVESGQDSYNPTAWVEGTTIYVAWLRNGGTVNVNTINTASGDSLGTQCTSSDFGTYSQSLEYVTLAVADNGTVYLATHASTSGEERVLKLTFSSCTFTDITTGSGLTTSDNPALTTIGNNLHMVFQEGSGLNHSVYDGTSWTTSNTTIDIDSDSVYSLTADSANLWLLTVDSSTSAAFYKCTSCASSSSWSSQTSPWTGQTNLTWVSLTYDSTNTDLYAMVIKDTSEQAYFKSTDTATISWSGETSFGFTAGDLGHISSPSEGAGTSQIGVTLRQAGSYRFSNLTPSQSIILNPIDN